VNDADRPDQPVRTIFLGSGHFGLPALERLAEHPSIDLVAVVTAPARPAGRAGLPRPTVIAAWAERAGVQALTPVHLRDAENVADIMLHEPELLVLADYGQIVPADLLHDPRHGALNLHPSLLPRHRGAAPIPAAIAAGDLETGVSLMLMDEGLDTGPIVAQRRVAIGEYETAPELEARLAQTAAELLAESIGAWLAGELVPLEQAESGVTLTRPLRREDGLLDPSRTAIELERHVRAYQPWPGSFIETSAGRLIVWRAAVHAGRGDAPGSLGRTQGGGLALATSDGLLELVEVQPAGGRRMTGAELLRGRPALVSR
jgi:methionyl-tRNA formyltransferase